jgi:hypothetical protein
MAKCFGFKSGYCRYPFKVSKRFRLEFDEEEQMWYARGSACDMAKVVRDIEWAGYDNIVDYGEYKKPVFRSKRDYMVCFDNNYGYYSVYRLGEEV